MARTSVRLGGVAANIWLLLQGSCGTWLRLHSGVGDGLNATVGPSQLSSASKYQLATVKSLGVSAGRIALHSTQTHQRLKCGIVEPVLALLRRERIHQMTNFHLCDFFSERHEYGGLPHVAVVFWNLVFQDEVIAEGIPG